MTDRIRIAQLEVATVIGVLPHERLAPQRIVVDAEVRCDTRAAAASDRIEDAVDYAGLAARLARRASAGRPLLVEALAEDLAETCLADARVTSALVTVTKPDALREALVSVAIERTRGDAPARPPHSVFVALTAAPRATAQLRHALARFHKSFGALRVSGTWQSCQAPERLHVAVELRTALAVGDVERLLRAIQRESRLEHEGVELDVEVLLYDELVLDGALVLPHAALRAAPHLLVPAAEIGPDVLHPWNRERLATIRDRLPADSGRLRPYDGEPVW